MDPEIALSFEALSKDATIWDAAADSLESSRSELSGIEVYRGAFSFAAMDTADVYAQLHQQVMTLLQQGATATRDGANALRAVREDFERFEDITKADLYAVWQPVV
ncbi:hypothetical protein [Leifsonia aquatica]|uniref:hypothetical protein n=1 Tax=Leifsonia aquatica TaxID=144185 RepID=UPI000469A32C|nr:hypothetical protein [Leifsonia aquatica]